MGCDFKPGDEVVCVRMDCRPAMIGGTFTIARVHPPGVAIPDSTGRLFRTPGWTVWLVEEHYGPTPSCVGFIPDRFRKVQKRNDRLTIEAFSVIKDGGFEEPKRAPAKKRERV